MLTCSGLVAISLCILVPLIVVVKYKSNRVVEAVAEAVRRCEIDQLVEAAVEAGKICVPRGDFFQQGDGRGPEGSEGLPERGIGGESGEGLGGAKLEHLADFKEFQRETRCETLQNPAGIRTLFDQSEPFKAIQEFADHGRRDAELPSQLQLVDCRPG